MNKRIKKKLYKRSGYKKWSVYNSPLTQMILWAKAIDRMSWRRCGKSPMSLPSVKWPTHEEFKEFAEEFINKEPVKDLIFTSPVIFQVDCGDSFTSSKTPTSPSQS